MLTLLLACLPYISTPPDSGEHKNLAQYRQTAVFINPIEQLPSSTSGLSQASSGNLVRLKIAQSSFEWKIPDAIQNLQDVFIANNTKKEGNGFRIQLLTSTDNNLITKTRLQFLGKKPDIQVYTIYERPYFKLRAGDFISKAEALRVSGYYKFDFPAALVVPDKIKVNQKRKIKSEQEKED